MSMYLRTVCLLIVAITSFGQTQQDEQDVKWGTVESIVVDGDGKPLPEATVTSYTDVKGVTRNVMQHQVNGNGEFSLRLPEGTPGYQRTKLVRGIRTRSLPFT